MQSEKRKSAWAALWALVLAGMLTGCGRGRNEEAVRVEVLPYEKTTYPTVTVKRGDLMPMLVLDLHMETHEKIDYAMDAENLQVEKVYVTEGMTVKKGDVLVRFSSGEMEEELAAVKQEIAQNNMLIDHYEKLGKINPDEDYKDSIKSLKEDVAVLNLKCQEIAARIEDCSIVAKEDGMISYVNAALFYELPETAGNLITEECGSDDYTVTVTEDYPFREGEEYEAKSGVAVYRMRLDRITQETGGKMLVFSPVSDMSGLGQTDQVTITIKKPVLSDVVYVDENAVFQKQDVSFVYRLNADGYREAVTVTTGETVEGNIVITSGLSGGEQVTQY